GCRPWRADRRPRHRAAGEGVRSAGLPRSRHRGRRRSSRRGPPGSQGARELPGARGMSDALAIGGLTVGAGEIVALLGGNGAGKTALLETVLGFRSGAVSLFGRDVGRLAVEQRVALGVGYVPERRRVFAGL